MASARRFSASARALSVCAVRSLYCVPASSPLLKLPCRSMSAPPKDASASAKRTSLEGFCITGTAGCAPSESANQSPGTAAPPSATLASPAQQRADAHHEAVRLLQASAQVGEEFVVL